MKRQLQILLMASALLITGITTGCKHDTSVKPAATVSTPPAGPSAGKWVISYLVIRTADMSHHLDGYTFTFTDGGLISVDNKVDIISGTWATGLEGTTSKLMMNMPNADQMLAELNKDWVITTNTSADLQLVRSAGANYSEVHFIRQ